jgi:hypothetical protein
MLEKDGNEGKGGRSFWMLFNNSSENYINGLLIPSKEDCIPHQFISRIIYSQPSNSKTFRKKNQLNSSK